MHPAGLLKPNDLGLLGLAQEWTSDEVYFSPEVQERVLRGSSRFWEPEMAWISTPAVVANRPTYLGNECGFRVVRTLPAPPAP